MIQVFVDKPFPRPRIVLSDRAQIFLSGALRIWNGETMGDFLQRAYRLVTDKATDHDYEKTTIHACLAHVLAVSNVICCNSKCSLFNLGFPKNDQ